MTTKVAKNDDDLSVPMVERDSTRSGLDAESLVSSASRSGGGRGGLFEEGFAAEEHGRDEVQAGVDGQHPSERGLEAVDGGPGARVDPRVDHLAAASVEPISPGSLGKEMGSDRGRTKAP